MPKYGDVREDGKIFRCWQRRKSGRVEHWVTPEAFQHHKELHRKHQKELAEIRRKDPEVRKAYNALMADYSRRERRAHPHKGIFKSCRNRAKKKGMEFTLTYDDIIVPEFCPILGIKLVVGEGNNCGADNSPALDRIENNVGYIPGNVIVVSHRANRIKTNATVLELQKVAAFYAELERTRS